MFSRMFSRSLYQLNNGVFLHNLRTSVKHEAFQPLIPDRCYGNTSQSAACAFSLDQTELAKFAAMADGCKDPFTARPFEGLKFVDVGCGGGILSEITITSFNCLIGPGRPLARMGASVTGNDALEKNIKIARLHADLDPVASSVEYRCTTAVIALEVIEHVAAPAEFCKSLSALTANNGATVISTVNRSMRAYASTIVAAEYILHWLPKGMHQWSSFITPEELVLTLQHASVSVEEMAGFAYRWSI